MIKLISVSLQKIYDYINVKKENTVLKILKYLYKNHKLACFYWDNHPEDVLNKLFYGKIMAYDKDYWRCMIKKYDKDGSYKGIFVGWLGDLSKIKFDTTETKTIEKMISVKKEKKNITFPAGELEDDDDLLYETLLLLQKKEEIISIVVNDDYFPIIGIVRELDKQFLQLERLDFNGESDGFVFISYCDICYVEIENNECRKRKQLKKNRLKKMITKAEEYTRTDILKGLYERQIAAEFYENAYDSPEKRNYQIGYVTAWDSSDVMLQLYDEYGNYEGLYCVDCDDDMAVPRIIVGSKKLKIFEKLVLSAKRKEKLVSIKGERENLKKEIFTQLREKREIIPLEYYDGHTPYGIIKEVTESILQIERLNIDGMLDGFVYLFNANPDIITDTRGCNQCTVVGKQYTAINAANHTIITFLEELYKRQILAEIYIWSNSNAGEIITEAGYIQAWDEDYVLIKKYDGTGCYEGMHIVSVSDLHQIVLETAYLENLSFYIKSSERVHDISSITGKSEALLKKTLLYLQKKKEVAFIQGLYDEFPLLAGIIQNVGKNILQLKQYDPFGIENGFIYIEIDSIQVSFDTPNCKQWKERIQDTVLSNQILRENDTFAVLLKRLCEKHRFVGLYKRAGTAALGVYETGYILALDKSDLLIEKYNAYGIYEGIFMVSMDDLCRIEIDSIDIMNMEKTLKPEEEKNRIVLLAGETENLRKEIFLQLIYKKVAVSVTVQQNSCLVTEIGYVTEYHHNMLWLNHRNADGTNADIVISGSLEMIAIDTKECNEYQLMHEF